MTKTSRSSRCPGLLLALTCAVGMVGLSPLPAEGQRSTTRGLNLGLHLQGASLEVEGGGKDGGGGLGFRVGYGFNRIVSAYFELDGVSVDSENAEVFQGTWSLGHADLGVRFHFANALRAWVPYLELAAGARFASVSDVEAGGERFEDVSFSGGSFSFGGGIDVYFSQTLALDVGLKVSGGEFTEVDLGPVSLNNLDIDATSTRFKVGVVWWP
jgi:hypothetical protein